MFKAIQKAKAKKGFTLVELIVVIAIIAILMLVLVPSLLAYINKANKSKAESNAKMVYDAALAAYTELAAADKDTSEASIVSQVTTDATLSGVTYDVHNDASNTVSWVEWKKDSTKTAANAAKGEWARWPAA